MLLVLTYTFGLPVGDSAISHTGMARVVEAVSERRILALAQIGNSVGVEA